MVSLQDPRNIWCIFVQGQPCKYATSHSIALWHTVFPSFWLEHTTMMEIAHQFFPVVTPTTTLLTSFPLSSTVIGFSTTTVTFWGWDLGTEVDEVLYADPLDAGLADGVGATVFTPVVVIWLHMAHFTECAPYGYIKVVWQWPQLTWAILFTGLTRLTVLQHEHLTVSALRVYISKVRQPPHISWAISSPGGGTVVTAWHTAQQTLGAPRG